MASRCAPVASWPFVRAYFVNQTEIKRGGGLMISELWHLAACYRAYRFDQCDRSCDRHRNFMGIWNHWLFWLRLVVLATKPVPKTKNNREKESGIVLFVVDNKTKRCSSESFTIYDRDFRLVLYAPKKPFSAAPHDPRSPSDAAMDSTNATKCTHKTLTSVQTDWLGVSDGTRDAP